MKITNETKSVEAAVASLQEYLADGDPTDEDLRIRCEADLSALRVAYRANPAAFSRETIEALRELNELLRGVDSPGQTGAPDKASGRKISGFPQP
jgi:hypothetical protein